MNQGQYENLYEQAQLTNKLLSEIADLLKESNERFAPVELSTLEEIATEVKPTKGRKTKAYN